MNNKKIKIDVIDKRFKQQIDIHIKKPEIALEKECLNFFKGDEGKQGKQGEAGSSISTITKTSTSGLVDTYTITLTDGNTSTFDVTNGKDGEDGQTGADGKSAYETAQEGGYSGTEQQFSSALANIDNFITKAVNDLTYYYTKTEVNSLIGAITTITATIVSVLPTADSTTYFNTSKTIYMVNNSAVSGTDYYYEYITIRTGTEGSYVYSWEKIGDTRIDLSGYVQTSRKINNKALTSDITLTASDVGALPDTTIIPTVNNPTITLTQGGVTKGSFTLNQSSGDTIALDAGGGSSTDVQVDSNSITSQGVADLKTINGNYNASTNKLATANDLITFSQGSIGTPINPLDDYYTKSQTTNIISNPNFLINGDFRVNQRGQAEYNNTNAGSNKYTVDRWIHYNSNSYTLAQISGGGITVSATGGDTDISQFVENGYNIFSNSDITASINADGTIYSITCQIETDTSFEKQIYTNGVNVGNFIVQCLSNNQLKVWFRIYSGKTVNVYWVKLEKGSIATSFSPKPYAEELQMCQRYFQKFDSAQGSSAEIYGFGFLRNSTTARPYIPLNTPLRILPTVTYVGGIGILNYRTGTETTTNLTVSVFHCTNSFITLSVTCTSSLGNQGDCIQMNGQGSPNNLSLDAEIY